MIGHSACGPIPGTHHDAGACAYARWDGVACSQHCMHLQFASRVLLRGTVAPCPSNVRCRNTMLRACFRFHLWCGHAHVLTCSFFSFLPLESTRSLAGHFPRAYRVVRTPWPGTCVQSVLISLPELLAIVYILAINLQPPTRTANPNQLGCVSCLSQTCPNSKSQHCGASGIRAAFLPFRSALSAHATNRCTAAPLVTLCSTLIRAVKAVVHELRGDVNSICGIIFKRDSLFRNFPPSAAISLALILAILPSLLP